MCSEKENLALRLLLLFCSMVLASCSVGTGHAPTPAISDFRVAILLPRAVSDSTWSRSGYEGLMLIQQELSAEIDYTENVGQADAERVFTQYAAQGYDLVIGHGNQFYTAAEQVAVQFPRVKFLVVGNFPGNNANLGVAGFRDAEVGYLVGVVAALKSKTGKIAYIGGVENNAQMQAWQAVEQGIRDTNPDGELVVSWVGDFTNTERALELANQHVADGVDILIHNADAAGVAVLKYAEEIGLYGIGWAQDQHHFAPKAVLTSAIQRVPMLLLQSARLVRRGRWEGKRYMFGINEQALDIAPFYGLLTPEEEEAVTQVRQAIMTGRIKLNQ
jgi:basic membrane protein A and related proteins